MKRYSLVDVTTAADRLCPARSDMQEDPEGEWVRYEDVKQWDIHIQSLIGEEQELRTRLEKSTYELDGALKPSEGWTTATLQLSKVTFSPGASEVLTQAIAKAEVPQPDFWTCDDTGETLTWDDKDDAIEESLDDYPPTPISELPETIEVYGYSKMRVDRDLYASFLNNLLESLLERLDEDYGDPNDSDYTLPTPEMKRAARLFLDEILENYTVYMCEQVCTETVNVQEWIKANRPDWLEGNDEPK